VIAGLHLAAPLAGFAAALAQAWRATSLAEVVSVGLGIAYLFQAVGRSRWCWVTGGISSAILVYLSFRQQLPMQALLNVYYVAVSVYGWWTWSAAQAHRPAVTLLPLRWHLAGCAAVVVASAVTAQWFGRGAEDAWPWLDSLTTWGSLFATWLTARAKLENWAYWLVIDGTLAFLFFEQRLYLWSFASLLTLVAVVLGQRAWMQARRDQAPAAVLRA